MQVGSAAFVRLLVSWVLAALAYSFVVAKIERAFQAAEYALFDPYEILGISESSSTNTTVVKQAYRQLAKVHHPDKAGGDAKLFQKISKAYDALTDAHAMRNYRLYGHPDGPLSTPAFQMALPAWLLFPEGNVAAAMLLVYMGMIAFLIYFVLQQLRTNKNEAASPSDKSKAGAVLDSTNSVSIADLEWLANHLKPDSTHFDVLMAVLTTPELVQWSLQDLARVEKARTERLQQKQQAATADDYDKLFTEGGWDEDDDGDNTGHKQSKGDEPELVLEGIDEGVLGQKWVEGALAKAGEWPPASLGCVEGETLDYNGNPVTVLEHPGVRRMLCMTQGRLNSVMLNAHPELLAAGKQKLIDHTYFKASMEFRQRANMFLEAALRVGMTLRSQRLVATVVETVAIFRIGVSRHDTTVPWFNKQMTRTYAILPRLIVKNKAIAVPGGEYDDVTTSEIAEVTLDTDRLHAENFTKQKVMMFKKQGIPPEVALRNYREGWWFMLRTKRLDGSARKEAPISQDQPILKSIDIDPAHLALFEQETGENRLVTATPIMFQNVAQKQGKINIKFMTPDEPGKYRYYLAIKSQDFLGADQELEIDVDVLDRSVAKARAPKEEKQEQAAVAKIEQEPKKDK